MTPYDSTPAIPAEPPASRAGTGTIRDVTALTAQGYTNAAATDALEQVASRFAVAITPAMLDLIDPPDPDDPIARQFVPSEREPEEARTEVRYPIGA